MVKKLVFAVVAVGIVSALALAFRPAPVEIDLGQVSRGALLVTVDHEGKTRIRERYVVSAPLTGRLQRITLFEGDEVKAGETFLAQIEPSDPALLDSRARDEALARFHAAEAALKQATPNRERSRAALEFAQLEHRRKRELGERKNISQSELDEAEMLVRTRAEELKSAEFAMQIAEFELEQARAALPRSPESTDADEDSRLEIRSPISGRVLRVLQKSAAVVTPGTELLELGDPRDLEVVIDVLSSDGVKITSGDRVILEHWGGDRPLAGRVRLVEPAAFTKVSALGVEEQRVNVIVDFDEPLEVRAGLGDSYRVEARIVIWEGADVLQVPASALFRHQDQWAVFRVEGGRARVQTIEIGHRNAIQAEVTSGLELGQEVIVHPSDKVAEGVRILVRPE